MSVEDAVTKESCYITTSDTQFKLNAKIQKLIKNKKKTAENNKTNVLFYVSLTRIH